ncbi:unnamed protein product [Rotaria sp. Silwood2]|nr:unnamed protein product [Rotaria sp. Silwood2]
MSSTNHSTDEQICFLILNEGEDKKISLPSTPFVANYFYYPNGEFKHPDDINQLIEYDYSYQLYIISYGSLWTICNMFIYVKILLQWSDLVKLRCGSRREDSLSLYRYMKVYTRLIAKTFHDSCLDNYHSTPLWFAEQMMDYVRELNPNFYINTELFTGNMSIDIHFIN